MGYSPTTSWIWNDCTVVDNLVAGCKSDAVRFNSMEIKHPMARTYNGKLNGKAQILSLHYSYL